MALRLDEPEAGLLLDPFGGQADLRGGVIRVLHEHSFRDDATRILRAARYESRFGFEIEPQTLAWLRRDAEWLHAISGARLHHEFSRIFHEETPERPLSRLDVIGALSAIHPALAFGPEQVQALAWLRAEHPHNLLAACWPLLVLPKNEADAAVVAHRLALTTAQRIAVEAVPEISRLGDHLSAPSVRPSEVAAMLEQFPIAALWASAAVGSGLIRERMVAFLTKTRYVKCALRGDDVIALGVRRGPEIGEVLRRLRAAKLDGGVRTRRDEEGFVRDLLAGAQR